MLSEKMQHEINKQINAELFSSYLYLSMSAYFDSVGLKGFANWMKVQAQEELTHAGKFYDYLLEVGAKVKLTAIDAPETEWKKPLEAFENAYTHEIKVTSLINNLANIAVEEKDHRTNNFLQWFINEQVEEEANANDVVQKLKLVGDNSGGLFMIDRELATRTFVMPPAGTANSSAN